MFGLVVIGLGLVFLWGLWGLYKNNVASRRMEALVMLHHAARKASERNPRRPDIKAASKAFAAIVLARRSGHVADLHALEMSNAEAVLTAGGTELEALSARWGGVMAIEADLDLFQIGVVAYEETVAEAGDDPTEGDPQAKFNAAGALYLAHVLAERPGEYETFLGYIRR